MRLTFSVLMLGCWAALVLASCQSKVHDQEAYPLPPATQALATLLARGVATGEVREYPAPIPGPLAAPSTIEASPNLASTQALATPGTEPPLPALAARFYLAGRLFLEVSQVRLVSWKSAGWITPNLGCQVSPDFDPSNSITGWRIILAADGQDYEVHSDLSGEQLCLAKPLEPGERVPLMGDYRLERAVEMAQMHLASRLGISLEEILVSKTQAIQWEDSHLGCQSLPGEQPEAMSTGQVSGYEIILSDVNASYEYHSGGEWLVYCGVRQSSALTPGD